MGNRPDLGDTKLLHGLLVTGMDGEEVQLVLAEAGSQGPEHPGGLVLVCEQYQLGLGHGCAEDVVYAAPADAADNVRKGSGSKSLQILHCHVTWQAGRQ